MMTGGGGEGAEAKMIERRHEDGERRSFVW